METEIYYQQYATLLKKKENGTLGKPERNCYQLLDSWFKMFDININDSNIATYEYPVPSYNNGEDSVDLCLFLPEKVFTEVKRFDQELHAKDYDQIIRYLNNAADCNVAILTNTVKFIFFVKRSDNRSNRPITQFFEIDMDKRDNIDAELMKVNHLFKSRFADIVVDMFILMNSDATLVKETFEVFNEATEQKTIHIDTPNENKQKALKYKTEAGVIEFVYNSVDLRKYVSLDTKRVLLGFNMKNCFGHLSTDRTYFFYSSQEMKDNRTLVEEMEDATYLIMGDESLYQYMKDAFRIIGISERKLEFKKINNDEFSFSQKDKDSAKKILRKIERLIEDMKFDVAILNPPYKDKLYIDILSVISKKAERMIFVSPLSWILNKPSQNKIIDLAKKHKCIIKYFDAFKYFGRNGNRFSGIVYIDTTMKEKAIQLNECTYDNTDGLVYAHGFSSLVGIYNKIYPNISDNLDNHIYYSDYSPKDNLRNNRGYQTDNIPCVIIPFNIGDKFSLETNQSKCIIRPVDVKNNTIIKYYADFSTGDKYYIPCPSTHYAENVVKFLMTDFARVCLFFRMTSNVYLINRYTKNIPWQDFEDDVLFSGTIDEISNRLFKKYGITLTEEQKAFIEEKFPKVYDL